MKMILAIVLAVSTVGCGMKSLGTQRDFIYGFCQPDTEGVSITTSKGQVWECKDSKWIKKS